MCQPRVKGKVKLRAVGTLMFSLSGVSIMFASSSPNLWFFWIFAGLEFLVGVLHWWKSFDNNQQVVPALAPITLIDVQKDDPINNAPNVSIHKIFTPSNTPVPEQPFVV